MKANRASRVETAARRGFTLLEMCIVLFIIALLAATAVPALTSAFNERALRDDSHGFSLLVRTAMLRSSEEQRPYVLTLDGKNLLLAPAAARDDSGQEPVADDSDGGSSSTQTLANTLKFPDATKKNAWNALPTASWTFQPDGLCPLPRVRFERGASYVELSFNALTGDVEDESNYLP
jgi:prepilin-type N-terminal cleavage/methylation domain-containing protein